MYPQFYPYNMLQNPNQFQQINQQNQFIAKQVTNIDEAKAYIVDVFNTYLFVDLNAGKIYLKKMNSNSGLSDFFIFTLNQEYNKDPLSEINERLIKIENRLGGIENVQSYGNNASDEKPNGNDSKSNYESNAK